MFDPGLDIALFGPPLPFTQGAKYPPFRSAEEIRKNHDLHGSVEYIRTRTDVISALTDFESAATRVRRTAGPNSPSWTELRRASGSNSEDRS